MARRIRNEGLLGPAAVDEARAYRDALWNLVKARYIARSEIPVEEAQAYAEMPKDLPASLEEAIEQADSFADQRFDKAQAAGELSTFAHNISGQETRVQQLKEIEASLKAEGEQLDQRWRALWAEVPMQVLAPDVMLAWLEARRDIVTLIGHEREVQRQLGSSRLEERETIAQVRGALRKVGWDAEESEGIELRVMVERADAFRREQETKAAKIVEMREAVRTARFDVARRQRDLEKAEAEWDSWRAEWIKAVAAIELDCDGEPDVLSAQMNVIDAIREHATAAKDLRDNRVAAIERDIETFERAVAEVTAELAPDLKDGDADAVVVELDRRRQVELKLQQEHQDLMEVVAKRLSEIEELEEDRKVGWISLKPLFEVAGVEEVGELRQAIERSDELRSLKKELTKVMEILEQQSDGLAIEIIEEECQAVDIDEARVREEAAEAKLRVIGAQVQEANVTWTEARKAFEAIGGDDAAARAAADREEALASMQDAAERYVRVRAAAMLLQWAVDRYRKEKQGPLLKRASELFRVLTLNSFERLEVGFDKRDAMHLTGVRPDGEVVAVPGLSAGTEDQLFLALRIAAVEDYLVHAVALPFVADDLFINFDPKRSAAGFEVLGQLAKRTQVLFYTHHPHLVDVARTILGADIHVVTLGDTA